MNFAQVFPAFFLTFFGIFFGAFFGRIFKIESRPFSLAQNYIFLPALIFPNFYRTNFDAQFFWLGAGFAIFQILVIFFAAIFTKFWPLKIPAENKIFQVFSTGGNITNFGLPLCVALFGDAAIAPVLFITFFGSIFLSTFGTFFAAGGAGNFKKSFLEIFKMPIFWAILVALFFNFTKISLPHFFVNSVETFGRASIPLSIFIFGVAVSGFNLKNFAAKNLATRAIFLKLFFAPILAILILKILPLDQLFAEILLIETATPLAVFSIILADIFKNDAAKTAGIVLLSTAISFATIPLWIFLAF